MESFMKKFVSHLLVSACDGKPGNNDHTNFLHRVSMRGDSDHYCSGDVIIPLKSPEIINVARSNPNSPLHTCVTSPSENSFESVKGVLSSFGIPVEKIWIEKNLLCFSLKRKEMIHSTLKTVLEAGQEYGKSSLLHSKNVVLTHDTTPEKTNLVNIYRGHIILNHIMKKLRFASADVQAESYSRSAANKLPAQLDKIESRKESEDSMPNVVKENTVVSVKEHVPHQETDCASEEERIRLYFISHGKSEALNRIQRGRVMKYMHLVDTKTGKALKISAENHFKILLNELRRAMELKYGDISSEEGNQFLTEQAWQCMTLHLLSKNYSDNLRVEIDENTQNTKDWAFVLYNYARLRMIFKSFEALVAAGDFTSLPSIEDIDFSLLKYDEEWVLVWMYIIRWPEIVEEFASGVLRNASKIKTSAIARFMHELSHRISVYYSRFRVLINEPLPHLMPLMYARLYLLKSLTIIMDICFDLMGIDSPPECM